MRTPAIHPHAARGTWRGNWELWVLGIRGAWGEGARAAAGTCLTPGSVSRHAPRALAHRDDGRDRTVLCVWSVSSLMCVRCWVHHWHCTATRDLAWSARFVRRSRLRSHAPQHECERDPRMGHARMGKPCACGMHHSGAPAVPYWNAGISLLSTEMSAT